MLTEKKEKLGEIQSSMSSMILQENKLNSKTLLPLPRNKLAMKKTKLQEGNL